MLMRKIRDIARTGVIVALLITLCHLMFAQNQTQPQEKPAVKKSQASGESCDGALDIVPVKSMTFTRKRRPAKTESTTPADSKADTKPEAKTDAKPDKQERNEGAPKK